MVKIKQIEMPQKVRLEKSAMKKIIGGVKAIPTGSYDPSTDTYDAGKIPEIIVKP